MSLSNLSGWAGSAYGASDEQGEKPAACGSAFGAGDKQHCAVPRRGRPSPGEFQTQPALPVLYKGNVI